MTVGLILAFLAYLLIYAGVKGVHPWGPIVEAFGGQAPAPPGRLKAQAAGGGAFPGTETPAGAIQGPPSADYANLTRNAARAKATIEATYPSLKYLGGFSCRKIKPHNGGTSDEWSPHAWNDAIDYGGDDVTMRKLVVWANLPHNRLRYRINNVIPPGSAVNAVHIDFFPSHAGQVPPCAGGS